MVFYIWYDDKGNAGRYQATADEQESHQRPLPVWLGKQVKDGNTQHLIAQWYRSDEYISNGFWSFRAEQLVDKFDDQVWIAYHESGSYYDTSLEEYTEIYREEQIRKHILLN